MSSSRFTTTTALIVALGGFLMGFDASVISGVVTFIEPEFNLSKIELGWPQTNCHQTTLPLQSLSVGLYTDLWWCR